MENDRIVEFEIKISHQEMAIEKLQQTVADQDSAIQKIELALRILKEKVEALARGDGTVGGPEKPPHY